MTAAATISGTNSASAYEAAPFLPFTGWETLRALREPSRVVIPAGIAAAAPVRWSRPRWFGSFAG